MELLDLPPEIIEHMLKSFTQSELYPVLFVCRTLHDFAAAIFRKTLTFRGDPWQCKSSPAHDKRMLKAILGRVLVDRRLAENIQTVNLRGWNRQLTSGRPWQEKDMFALMCSRLGLGDDFTAAMETHEAGDSERMTILLLQCLPNVRHLHIQPPHEGTADDKWPGYSFCKVIADLTTRRDNPMLTKLETLSLNCKLYSNNIGLEWISGFASCRKLRKAELVQFRRNEGIQEPFRKNDHLRKLVVGRKISKIWSAYYETNWYFEDKSELKSLLRSCTSLTSLEFNHNANIFTWAEDFNSHMSPLDCFDAFVRVSKTLEELNFTTDCLDCIAWRNEEQIIGSFQQFTKLTSLRTQLLLLAKAPNGSEKARQRLCEILPPNLRTLTLLDCSRWAKQGIDSKMYSKTFTHWNEHSFTEEMTVLLEQKSKYVPHLEKLALGEAIWQGASVVPKLQALARANGVEIVEDHSHYAGKLDRWFREPLTEEYVSADADVSGLTMWEPQ